jgi:hypothetical protein
MSEGEMNRLGRPPARKGQPHTRADFVVSLVLGLLLMFGAHGRSAAADRQIPDALLKVTVQQRQAGRLNREFHVQELRCWRGECVLTSLTLNSCRQSPVSQGQATPLVIERSSTRDGSLHVTNDGNTLVVVETGSDVGGRYTTTQRFTYERPASGDVANRLLRYSGGFIKNSSLSQQVMTVELVPLRGVYKETTLDCPLGLPGVEDGE